MPETSLDTLYGGQFTSLLLSGQLIKLCFLVIPSPYQNSTAVYLETYPLYLLNP